MQLKRQSPYRLMNKVLGMPNVSTPASGISGKYYNKGAAPRRGVAP